MRLHREAYPVTVLGPGRRYGIWVQGCARRCPGCASSDTWDYDGGEEVEVSELVSRIIAAAQAEGLTGLTVTCGEPLDQTEELCRIIAEAKETLGGDFDVLVFTGNPVEEIPEDSPIFTCVDAMVCGPYMRDIPGRGALIATDNQELLLLTDLARARYTDDYLAKEVSLQATTDGRETTLVGIPEAGTLDRLERLLLEKGVALGDCSWKN